MEKTSLKLVLKVGGAPSTPEVVIDSLTDDNYSDTDRRQRHKKKKRHHEKHSHRHHDKKPSSTDIKKQEADTEDGEDSEEDVEPVQKRLRLEEEDEEDNLHVLRNLREKKSNEEDKTPLQMCLSYIHKLLQRKDTNGFFAFPVTDNIAPGYSSIISNPMDFSTMKTKMDDGVYHSVSEFRNDYELMMKNCMMYNHPDTVYHKEAKRLLAVGLKHMNREKLVQMKRGLPFMVGVTKEELGFEDETAGDDSNPGSSGGMESLKANKTVKPKATKPGLDKFEAIPDDMTPEEILEQAQGVAQEAANKLMIQAPDSRIGFLRRQEDGTTTLNILNPDDNGLVSEKERVVNLGSLIGKLTSGTGSLLGFKEDKRNKVNPVAYLNYGAFSSYAPVYDSSSANISKEESDLLLSTYADETGLQYSKSLQHFVADAGDYTISMVDDLLNVLTSGEHSKVMDHLRQKEENERQEQEVEAMESQTEDGVEATTNTTKNGLDDLGIETSFLSGFENRGAMQNSEENDDAVQKKLDQTAELILNLQRTQYERLSEKLPEHLAYIRDPSKEEIELANKVTTELTELVKQVKPSDVVKLENVRSAMGIALLPSQTNDSTSTTATSSSWQTTSQSSPAVVSTSSAKNAENIEAQHTKTADEISELGEDLFDLFQQGDNVKGDSEKQSCNILDDEDQFNESP